MVAIELALAVQGVIPPLGAAAAVANLTSVLPPSSATSNQHAATVKTEQPERLLIDTLETAVVARTAPPSLPSISSTDLD